MQVNGLSKVVLVSAVARTEPAISIACHSNDLTTMPLSHTLTDN